VKSEDRRFGSMAVDRKEEDNRIYKVVVNDEGQYSIWFADKSLPNGWVDVGKEGSKQDCLEHIKLMWTDMRPLSLRKRMSVPHS
jgi:MbtH protein